MLATANDTLEVMADQQVIYDNPTDSDIEPYVVKHVFTDTDQLVHATIPTQYQEYIYKSRYAKWREDDSRRENWPETPARYCDFFYNRFPDTFPYAKIYNAIITMQDMPSMRALMTAGYALHRDNAAGYNCAYTAIDDPVAFDEIMYLLMCGTGVGFSVERQFINKLPRVADEFYKTNTTIVVEDSKIGWATSFREIISLLYSGKIPKWDTSKVRKAGEKLKTFGGRASGPAPLIALFHFTVKTFTKAKGRKLTSIECHDLVCKIADIVVVGGVRRSALISLSNLSDDRMREAKSGDWRAHEKQRELANNSVAYTEKPEMHRFMEEWLSLMKSYSGERGIFNREGLTKKIAKTGRRDTNYEFGTNPCLTPDMRILTRQGNIPIGILAGQQVEIWNGYEYSTVVPFSTGVNPIWSVGFSNGAALKVTPYHKFILEDGSRVEARNLQIGSKIKKFNLPEQEQNNIRNDVAYSQGFYSGDGCSDSRYSYVYEPKYSCIPRLIGNFTQDATQSRMRWVHGNMLPKNYVPVNQSADYVRNWLAGLFDADGCVLKNPNSFSLQLTSIDYSFLNEIRVLLTTFGIHSKVRFDGRENREFQGYPCQDVYRLLINSAGANLLLQSGVVFSRLQLSIGEPNRDASRFITVESIRDLNYSEETFCLTEPKNNSMVVEGVLTAQCAEIALRSCGFCNLTENVIRYGDTLEVLKEKVEIATIMGTYQSTLVDFRYLRPIWKKNQEEERLLGVSMTGIMDHEILSKVSDQAKEWLTILREHTIAVNKIWADKLGIKASAAITTVKPSGTVSQLVNSASGIHARYHNQYVRTVRADKKDPLCQYMLAQGFPNEDHVTKPDDMSVFSFPERSSGNSVYRNDMTAIECLEHYAMVKDYWCEHNVSITVNIKDNEWMEVGAWVYKHFDNVAGVSFLPYDGGNYVQAPYQECTEQEYLDLKAKVPQFNWDKLSDFEKDDATINMKELACVGNSCEFSPV